MEPQSVWVRSWEETVTRERRIKPKCATIEHGDGAPSVAERCPWTDVFKFYEPEAEEDSMEFRLIYKGRLPAEGRAGGRAKEKHILRKEFHKQLKELWKQHPDLRQQSESRFRLEITGDGSQIIIPASFDVQQTSDGTRIVIPTEVNQSVKTWLEHIADNHQRLGGRFVPLVSKAGGFTCSLDILFLRRDNPGGLISSGGDIDNRIKVLLDGLKMPSVMGDLGGLSLDTDENPFFCLLEDDSLITSVSVTTDRLLVPQETGDMTHDVYLIVRATVVNPGAIFSGNRLV